MCKQASAGQPLSQIAREFHCPLHTVQVIVKRSASIVVVKKLKPYYSYAVKAGFKKQK
jgi:hypothetical protein